MPDTPFVEFPKLSRLVREMTVTEKLDGTNAQICITDDGQTLAGSRNRWITPEDDNYGFARWVQSHRDELMQLGPGRHFGEWWGSGIQRGYGLRGDDKRFSLFNVSRWCRVGETPQRIPSIDPRIEKYQDVLPACCGLVPVLGRGMFDTTQIENILASMRIYGSTAVPGFMRPEGIVVFHTAGNVGFKRTLDGDEPKSLAQRLRGVQQ